MQEGTVMSRSGKIGYALTYNAIFLLIIPLVRLFAQASSWQDFVLFLLAGAMYAGGVILLNRDRSDQPKGMQLLWSEPLVRWRDRLARGLIAGAMIGLNAFIVVSVSSFGNSQAWSFFSLLSLGVLALGWVLILTSPSDVPDTGGGEV